MLSNKIQLGAKLEMPTGEKLGVVSHLLATSPADSHITGLVVQKGIFDTRQVLLTLSEISHVADDGKVVYTNLTLEELGELPDFNPQDYVTGTDEVTPANSEVPAYLYPRTVTIVDFATQVNTVIATPSVETEAATQPPSLDSSESSADTFQTESATASDSSKPNRAVLVIKQGVEVKSLDGKSLGQIKQINLDAATGDIENFVIEKGLLFKQDYIVPIKLVQSADETCIQLNVDTADFFGDTPTTNPYKSQTDSTNYRIDHDSFRRLF
jgi:uncharacterized protein YrrD